MTTTTENGLLSAVCAQVRGLKPTSKEAAAFIAVGVLATYGAEVQFGNGMTHFDLLQDTAKDKWNEWKIRESEDGITVSIVTGFGSEADIEEDDCEIEVCDE